MAAKQNDLENNNNNNGVNDNASSSASARSATSPIVNPLPSPLQQQGGGGQPPAAPPQLDASAVLAAREKSLISRAMDTVARTVARSDSNDNDNDENDDELEPEAENFDVEGDLIDKSLTKFQLATPQPMPSYLNVHFICETASRLLFLSIHWVRSIPAFSQLTYDTQVGLVRNAWSDLFVLGMAQCAKAMNLRAILSAIVTHLQNSVAQDKLNAQRVRQVTTTICKVQEYVKNMNKMSIDEKEFAYLKTVALFATGNFF